MSTRREAVKNIRFRPFWSRHDSGSLGPFEAPGKAALTWPNQTGVQIREEVPLSLRIGNLRTFWAVNRANTSGRLTTPLSSTATEYSTITGGEAWEAIHRLGVFQSVVEVSDPTEEKVRARLNTLFAAGREEVFEDGMESDFSRGVFALVREYGSTSVDLMAQLILGEQVNSEVAAEALRWLGLIEDNPTYGDRLRLLQGSLECSSSRVRDGAAIGLAALDDPKSIPQLKQAIEREQYAELRQDLKQVLAQLQETATEVG